MKPSCFCQLEGESGGEGTTSTAAVFRMELQKKGIMGMTVTDVEIRNKLSHLMGHLQKYLGLISLGHLVNSPRKVEVQNLDCKWALLSFVNVLFSFFKLQAWPIG